MLAACSAGITSANPAPSSSVTASRAGSSPAASPSHATSASADTGGAGGTVSVNAPIGSFPIPHGAQVVANMPCGKQILIELGAVTPAQAVDFYTAALPKAGYRITDSTLTSDPDTGAAKGMAELTFSGHGFTGLIIAMADLGAEASADPSVAGLPATVSKNAVEISLKPADTAGSPSC